MGSLERRIQQLEDLYRESGIEERASGSFAREELARKWWIGTLNAMAWIRRAPIDAPGSAWRYEVGRLRDKGPFAIATHIAALAALEHPDEDEARRILADVEAERGIEDSPLTEMIERMVAQMGRIREHAEP